MDYHRRVRGLKGFLVNLGQKEDVVQSQIEKATKVRREDLLRPWTIVKGGFHDFIIFFYLVLTTTLEAVDFIPGNEKILKIL